MAKGNMLLGYSRGSVGDVTFYRDGGEQRARARNRKPNNPRSNRQMYQRAKFAGAVKFFKQSMANFYRMAFENKKPNESDYNAFMRVNLAQSPLMSKTAFDKPGYPAIGHWTIAQGSMPTLQFEKNYGSQSNALAVVLPVKTDESISVNSTIGDLSSILINSGLYMAGDIFTMVRIAVRAESSVLATLPTATPEGNWRTFWTVTQILLDTADTRRLSDTLLSVAAGEIIGKDTDGYLFISNTGDDGFSLVTTRNTANGLKASYSEIVVTDAIETAITAAEGDDYKNAVLADWRASGENILQGALADPFEAPVVSSAVVMLYYGRDEHYFDLTAGTNNIIIQEDGENEIYFRFRGVRLPEIDNMSVSGITITGTDVLPGDETQRAVIYTISPITNYAEITLEFAGQSYSINIYKGATIEGIADGPNTPVQPPLSKTWPATSGVEAYELTPKTGEVVYNVNWDIPPMIASTNVQIQDVGGGKYGVQINRLQDAPSGDYVIKYCGQELVNVKIV